MSELKLILEGNSDRYLLDLIRQHGITGVEANRYQAPDGGFEWMRRNLESLLASADASRVAIVFDGNSTPDQRWQSIVARVTELGCPPPDANGITRLHHKPVGLWMMAGESESLLLSIAKRDAFLTAAEKAVAKLGLRKRDRAVLRTWLAWQDDGKGITPGVAIEMRLLDPNAAPAQALVDWVRRMLSTQPE